MRLLHAIASLTVVSLIAGCMTPGSVGAPPIGPSAARAHDWAHGPDGSAIVDVGAKSGASITVSMRPSFATAAFGNPANFYFYLRDAGTNAIVKTGGGFLNTVTFTNVPAGTYYAQVDAIDFFGNSVTLGGPQNSTNQVTVTGSTATYTSGFSLTVAVTIQPSNGGTVPIAITNPYAGGYGELIDNATGTLLSQYDSATSSFHLLQVADGTYRFWGMGRTGGFATLARQATNVTVASKGASVSGSWNLTIPNLITTLAGGGASAMANGLGPTSVTLGSVQDVTYDAAGNLYAIAGNRVVMVPVSGGTFFGVPMTAGAIYTIAGGAGAGSSGDGGPATSALLNSPGGLAVSSGAVYIADTANHRIRMVNAAGTISLVAGTSGGFSGDGGAATAAQLSSPRDVCVIGGTIYVADTNNSRIRTISGGTIASAPIAGLNMPRDVIGDANGNLLIADYNSGQVKVFPASTGTFYNTPMTANTITNIAAYGGVEALAVDAGGHVYMGSVNGVAIRTLNGTVFSVVSGGGGGADGVAAASSSIGSATGLALHPSSGGLAIADGTNGRVRFIN